MAGRWKDYFHFQKIERQGLILLTVLIIISLILIYIPNDVKEKPVDYSDFKQKIAAFEAYIEEKESQKESKSLELYEKKTFEAFYFDPNGLPIEDWMRLGLSRKQAEVIKNYEQSGGMFRKKEDVRKMYSISDELYESLEDFIRIKQVSEQRDKNFDAEKYLKTETKKSAEAMQLIDINMADSLDLMKLKGIGPAFSSRIIKYRNLLGGYTHKEQLREVWGLDSMLYSEIAPFIVLENNHLLSKINVNTATAKELAKHPYIDWKTANSLYKFRLNHSEYKKLEDIKQSHLIDDSLYRKIAPYLSIE